MRSNNKNIYIVVDVESDGGIIGDNSMVCFGAVILDYKLDKTFYGKTAPISPLFNEEALAISGFSRKEHETFDNPEDVMISFAEWLKDNCNGARPILISDNNGYDASWINYYFLKFYGKNPFGWSSRRIGDLFCGFYNNPYYQWKKHRKYLFNYQHTHNPFSDSLANAAALLYLNDQGFKLF